MHAISAAAQILNCSGGAAGGKRAAQRSQAAREVEMVIQRLQGVQRELDDGYACVAEKVGEDRSGAVVEAPSIAVEVDQLRLDQLGDLAGQRGIARGGIPDAFHASV